jgi:hypothetical protein
VKVLGALVGLGLLAFGIVLLRDATLSTHQPTAPDSRIELVMRVSINGGEARQTADEMAEATLLACRLEVSADPVEPLEDLGDGRFRSILSPSMDDTDQRQFRGCLEDWSIDHVRTDVERLEPLD